MMMVVSLVVNVAVLGPVLWGLLGGSPGSEAAFGPDALARRTLVCVSLAIVAPSAVLLGCPAGRAAPGPGLLAVQVRYRLATVAALGMTHPVAATNLAIAALHGATLAVWARSP